MISVTQEQQRGVNNGCRSHCIDCPAVRGEVLGNVIGAGLDECRFETLTVESRSPMPDTTLEAGTLVMVRRGVVIRQRLDQSGRAVAFDAVGPGAAYFVTEGDQAAYAVDRTLVCSCSKDVLLHGLRTSNRGLDDLHGLHCQTSYRMERLADARGRQHVRSRVAALLCVLSDTLSPNSGKREHLPSGILQRDLAALVSTRHESVCRIMRELAQDAIVAHGPDGIQIIDRERLASL